MISIGWRYILKLFTQHLEKTKSNYWRHFVYGFYMNLLALGIFITGTIHIVFPFLFEFTPYKLAKKIVDITESKFKND